jgi:hypothetical protein
MKSRKVLNNKKESVIVVEPIFSESELKSRHDDYINQSDKDFDNTYKEKAFEPVRINFKTHTDEVQYNYCPDTFCPNYAQPVEVLVSRGTKSVKNYIFIGSKEESNIACNVMKYVGSPKRVNNNYTTLYSNWSIGEEIKRLSIINSVINEKVEYQFHEPLCTSTSTPFEKDNSFVRYGKTNAGSIRYKCKECEKTTAIKPTVKQRHTYNQQRSDVVLPIFDDIIRRVPITQICDKNNIAPTTFYDKIEFIYMKCLEFLERHESKLSEVQFNDIYLCSDIFTYSLNNIRRKGKGGSKQTNEEKANATEAITNMISTGDVKSFYVFRSDICYDSDIRLTDIIEDTEKYHCDHSFRYLKKNERIQKYSYAPQLPTKLDSESINDYRAKLAMFEARDNFVEGLHIQQAYTAIAHFHLLKNGLNYKQLIFVSDDDKTIQQSIFKVFAEDFKNQNAFYFTSQYDKTLDRQSSFKESEKARNELNKWAMHLGTPPVGIYEKAILKVSSELSSHKFYSTKTIGGQLFDSRGFNLYSHPLPAKDEGRRHINLISYQNHLSDDELAEMIVYSNTRTVDNFFQEIRRHINLLERPLVGGRGTGKTYIYSNYNPKYAQMLVTIYRTYYNFIKTRKYYNRKKKDTTPAMRIGIATKPYTLKDIIYFI